MFLSGIISFLGGSVFRMIWGEVSSYFKQKQEHQQEIETMRVQAELDAGRHFRDLERLKLQSDLGVREVAVAGDMAIAKTEAEAFVEAMKNATKPTGNWFIDAWNGSIRPQYAEVALILWLLKLISQGFTMDDFDMSLLAVIAGFFFADRTLSKRGK